MSAQAGTVTRVDRSLASLPFYPLLFAAWPVLRLFADNIVDVDAGEVLVPLLLVLGSTAAGFALLSLLWRAPRRAALVITAIVVPFLTFGLIADAIAPLWPHEPIVRAYLAALAIWLGILVVAVYAAFKLHDRLGSVTQALNLASVVLLVLTLVPIVGHAVSAREDGQRASPDPDRTPAGAAMADAGAGRDIYHLVFDRYGSEDALRAGRGIDNSEFTGWLNEQGFHVVDPGYANFERTALSMASVHDMTLLEDLAERMGPDNPSQGPLFELIANSPAASTLQELGYHYVHIGSWFHQTAGSDIADQVVLPVFRVTFASTLLDQSAITGLSAIGEMATTLTPEGDLDDRADATATQFRRLGEVAAQPGPKYVFSHFLVPHGPYLFLADGTFDPETATFETQLEYANAQIRDFTSQLLALPEEERPIIILQADEGPYPERYLADPDAFDWSTATDDELVTKFGVLNAMYLPGPEGERPLPEELTLVNTYPEVLGRYFRAEVERDPDRMLAMRDGRLYDLMDITEDVKAATERLDPGDS